MSKYKIEFENLGNKYTVFGLLSKEDTLDVLNKAKLCTADIIESFKETKCENGLVIFRFEKGECESISLWPCYYDDRIRDFVCPCVNILPILPNGDVLDDNISEALEILTKRRLMEDTDK